EQPVDFDIADPKFIQAYFEILHHPYEAQGVDFWWLDWQQGASSKLAELDPLLGLNHFHFYDLGRDGSKRSFIFSRWFGLGNHRYPIGFSGDTIVSWESLAFQPYFTATAANVAYGWWSHDIGGHMRGLEDNELYARWVQFGAFSPILRLHSTNNPYQDRRPWVRDETTLRIIRAAMQLRHRLIPYLYTMAWRNHAEAMPLITPMYYDYPETEDAYRCPNQYAFGTELIAAPFTTPLDPDTRLSRQPVWLPHGDWFDFFTGEHYAGDRWLAAYGTLDDIPVFAKAGAIVPLAPKVGWGGIDNPTHLDIHIFPGADHRFEMYEDDGLTNAYQQGRFGLTSFSQHWQTTHADFTIEPVRGDVAVVPASRTYTLIFHCLVQPERVEVRVNSVKQEIKSSYAAASDTFTLEAIAVKPTDKVEITLAASEASLLARIDRRAEKCRQLLRTFRMESDYQRAIDERLPEVLADASVLQTLGAGVKDAHIAALRSVIENDR
ncbi:MAG TPA: TIM-barrel domain-containing protein, partial [Anaerolineae bacterium]